MFRWEDFEAGQVVDMSPVIQTVTPVITPFSSLLMSKAVRASGPHVTWIEEEINEDAAVTQSEGGDAPDHKEDSTDLMDNYLEIFAATAIVSNTAQASDAVGYRDLLAKKVINKMKAIKMRMENRFIHGEAGYDEYEKTYTTAGILNLINAANIVDNGGYDIEESTFLEMLEKLYLRGVNDEMICFLSAADKLRINSFDNVQWYAKDKFLGFDADVYVSVYGQVKFALTEKLNEGNIFVVNPNYLEMPVLIPFGGKLEPASGSKQSMYLETQAGVKLLNGYAAAAIGEVAN